jgi:hypothetical protein
MRNDLRKQLTTNQKKTKRRQLFEQQIAAWGVGGSGFRGTQPSVPPTPSAPAALKSPIAAPEVLPIGSKPLTPAARLRRLQELQQLSHQIHQAFYYNSQFLPLAFEKLKAPLKAEMAAIKQELRSLLLESL